MSAAYPFLPISASVLVQRDGSAIVSQGQSDLGTNSKTTLAQVAAEALGFKFEDVRCIEEIDTDTVPYTPDTGSSMTANVMGNTVRLAALDAKKKILVQAAQSLKVEPEDLEIEEGRIYVKSDPAQGITVKQLLTTILPAIIGTADWNYIPFPPMHDQGYCGYADVEVDTDTGEVKVLKLVLCVDVGQPFNVAVVENQAGGGMHMGLGHALMESVVYDQASGRMLNPNFLDHKFLTALDMPETELYLPDNLDPGSPFGAKSGGESSANTPAAAVANAVYNAIGVRIRDSNITPDKVLRALGKI